MSCSAEQIAEKKRLALERLKAKQTGTVPPTISPSSPQVSKAQLIADNKRLALERLKAKNNVTVKSKALASTNSASMFLSSNSIYTEQSDVGKAKPLNQSRPKPYDNRPTQSGSKPTNSPRESIFQKTVTCSCSLINSQRFAIKIQGFFAPLIDVFKLIPSRSYGWY